MDFDLSDIDFYLNDNQNLDDIFDLNLDDLMMNDTPIPLIAPPSEAELSVINNTAPSKYDDPSGGFGLNEGSNLFNTSDINFNWNSNSFSPLENSVNQSAAAPWNDSPSPSYDLLDIDIPGGPFGAIPATQNTAYPTSGSRASKSSINSDPFSPLSIVNSIPTPAPMQTNSSATNSAEANTEIGRRSSSRKATSPRKNSSKAIDDKVLKKAGGPKRIVRDKAKRQKHNETERRRLRKINDRISDLKVFMSSHGYDTKDNKTEILCSSLEFMGQIYSQNNTLRNSNSELIAEISTLRSLVTTLTAGGAANAGNGVNLSKTTSSIPSSIPTTTTTEAAPNGYPIIDYRRAFMFNVLPIVIYGADGTILDCNQLFNFITGYSREDMSRISMSTLLGKCEDNSSMFQSVSNTLTNSDAVQIIESHTKLVGFNNILKECMVRTILIVEGRDKPLYFLSIVLPVDRSEPLFRTSRIGSMRNVTLVDSNNNDLISEFVLNHPRA